MKLLVGKKPGCSAEKPVNSSIYQKKYLMENLTMIAKIEKYLNHTLQQSPVQFCFDENVANGETHPNVDLA